MADNYLKTPLTKSLNSFAEKKAVAAIQKTGRSLPCSVVDVISSGIVKVKFEVDAAPFTLPNLVVAKAGSEYVRIPTQVGDTGLVIAADARLGGVTGLGAGVASLAQPGNLAALLFMPLGRTDWPSVDLDVVVIYGPDGVTIRDASSGAVITLTPSSISMVQGAASITLTGGAVNIVGTLSINGSAYLAHTHNGVTTGGGISGGVT